MLEGLAVVVENAAGRVVLTEPGTITVVESADVAPSPPVTLGVEELRVAMAAVAF